MTDFQINDGILWRECKQLAENIVEPPKNGVVTRAFKKVASDVKLPDNLQIRDARSGGITEAKSLVDPMTLRDAAQHTQASTTDIYIRGRSDSANNVVRIRGEKNAKTGR